MQTTKILFYNVEAFHNKGNLVIQFMPEYLTQIKHKLSQAGFTGSAATEVECFKFVQEANKYMKLTMQQIELEYSNQAVEWFLAQSWATLQQ